MGTPIQVLIPEQTKERQARGSPSPPRCLGPHSPAAPTGGTYRSGPDSAGFSRAVAPSSKTISTPAERRCRSSVSSGTNFCSPLVRRSMTACRRHSASIGLPSWRQRRRSGKRRCCRPCRRRSKDGHGHPSERRVLLELQAVLDEISLDAVRDDTVWRAEERAAWCAIGGRTADTRCRTASSGITWPCRIRRLVAAVGGVSWPSWLRFGVLLGWPTSLLHRPTISVSGTIMSLWLRPQAGPDMPLVVYALDLPAGFPPVKPKDERGQGTSLNEEVEVTGYFFKRWAYAAQDDIRSVPLILAASPRWLDRPSPAADGEFSVAKHRRRLAARSGDRLLGPGAVGLSLHADGQTPRFRTASDRSPAFRDARDSRIAAVTK